MATDFTSQINAIYQAVQYRNGPTADVTVYNSSLNSGALTLAQVQASVIADPFTTSTVNPIIREYQAAFGRVPDQAGAAFWVKGLTDGSQTLTTLGTTFANSAEFNTRFGASANTIATPSVVTALYTNVLGRTPDAAGLAFWQASGLTASQLLNAFAGSAEFVTQTGPAVSAFQQLEIAGTPPTTGSLFAVAPPSNPGTTYVLTTSADIIPGTSGNDTISGFVDGTALTTFTAADSITGGAGIDTLNVTISTNNSAMPAASVTGVEIVNVRAVGANLTAADLSTFTGVTTFNADRATGTEIATNMAKGGVYGLLGDGSALFGATEAFGYASAADVATLNLSGGVKSAAATTVTLTGTGVTSTVINSTGAANTLSVTATAGAIVTAATSKSVTINATANLTTALTTTADTKLTVTGNSTVDLRGVNFGSALNNTITTIDASAETAGGLLVQAGNSTTLKFTGGAGNDTLGLGAVLTTGAAVDGGNGTDTLYFAGNSAYLTAATGALIKGFEVVDATTATLDLDLLAPTNTLTGLRVGGSATISNINAASAANTTIYANATPVLNVKGATTPGQIDTVNLIVDDGATAVNTITITAPTLTGVEKLGLTATDNITVTSLANALALTSITVTGAANTSITTTAIALNPNTTVDASASTGNFTLNAAGSTANGYSIKGSSGTNIITNGAAPISVDLTKSVSKADQVIITDATGTNINVVETITGFTNALTTGDKLDVINTGTITANVAAGTATGVTNLTAQITSGVITFGGTAAATATFTDKVNAAATLAGTTQYNEVAFEHAGSTYIYEQGDTTATYAAGTDLIVQLVGVTGVTALSTTASGANTVFAV